MQIIGEKINGTRKDVADAIKTRDADFIKQLAARQTDAGAAWLDVNAGTSPQNEPDDLVWLVETIQAAVDTPLCLDSANPRALAAAIKAVAQLPMINSINGDPARLNGILPLVKAHNCPVIALAMDGKHIPETCGSRMEIIQTIIEASRATGIPDEAIYIDPLVMTLSTNTDSALITIETMLTIGREFPEVHLVLGLSNISFGLPARSHVNRAFMTLAMNAGMDMAILDPLDANMMAAIAACELVLGLDNFCLNYTRSYRTGAFGPSATRVK